VSVARTRDSVGIEELRLWFNGLDVMRGLGVECRTLEPGRAVALLHVSDHQRNPGGAVNGGYLLAAADVTAGVAVTASTHALTSVTSDLSMHFLASAVDGPLVIDAELIRQGRRSCVPTVRITDAVGVLCAVATGTWVVRADT
jgi:uncharacterized protein (TIGR00369 family)